MALISPGQSITVTDESQYVSGAVGSVPLVVFATAQDKINPAGTIASGTTSSNAGKLQVFTSQRELVSALGYPTFQQSSAGTPLHGDERNEYGLMAAYSTLGLANRVYGIRADIDVAQLTATAIRPVGTVATGTNWLDLETTNWGLNEWDATNGTFTKITPTVVLSDLITTGNINTPSSSIGTIGSYAVTPGVTGSVYGSDVWHAFYKNTSNVWTLVGTDAWALSHPTVKGAITSPIIASSTPAASITINGNAVIVGSTTVTKSVTDVVAAITAAGIAGVTAAVVSNKLEIYVSSLSQSTWTGADGKVALANTNGTPLSSLGVVTGTYARPIVNNGSYVAIPSWRSTDVTPRPSGSVFLKTTATGDGANFVINRYSALTQTWAPQAAPVYLTAIAATYGMDSSGGGYNIAANSIYVRADIENNGTVSAKPYVKLASGPTKITGTTLTGTLFTIGHSLSIGVSSIGTDATTVYSILLDATSRSGFVAKVLSANIPELNASIDSAGYITLTHKYGGVIILTTVTGTAIADAGFNTTIAGVQTNAAGQFELSGFTPLAYTYSLTTPTQNPVDGTLWYYGSATEVDILINTTTGWKGYKNETSDSRGYALINTDPLGVIVSASKPTSQTDSTVLVPGDIWLDTSDLENWPKLSRYTGTTWTAIDNTDQIGQNGIIFADARWDTTGTSNVVSSSMIAPATLLASDYLDLDAPDYRLYPRGMLMFNTRRSGYNVKRFVSDYYNATAFPNVGANTIGLPTALPASNNAWVSSSGLKDNGSMYAGYKAQRQMIVSAMKGAIDASTELREEQFQFNLIAAPGYPELIANMVSLNNDRANTAFILGDTPMRLTPNGIAIANWSNNADNATGLSTNDPYLGVYYPGAALSNDVQGHSIVVPSSHITLRTFLHSDNISYQWFAPAGTRRGLVDNALSVGYIDPSTGEYNPIGVNQGLRDSLYENKINPITNLPGIGLVVWGQKTRNPVASSMDRINVARLVNYIRTILAHVGHGFLFEPNDKITRDQLKTIISGAVNDLVSKRGVYDYLVVCDDSNNTPTRIARNELYVDIAIEPMKDVEFIYIPIRLFNPGDVSKLGG